MNIASCIAIVGSMALYVHDANSYEIQTHANLSEAAFDQSGLRKDALLLQNLGLKSSDTFPNSQNPEPKTMRELIADGARFEDTLSLSRPINHFFNPLNGQGLGGIISLVSNPSPNWALEDKGQISGALGVGNQEFSYRDARQYFYDALTQTDKAKREENFGRTFQSLGQIIHHIQDMAQPQHVRNDIHLDLPFNKIGDIPGIENPSVYEKYTNRPDVRGRLPINFSQAGYDINDPKFAARFNKPRNFWETPTGEGIAQFTNFNFLSAGTNFDNPGIFNFPLRTPALRSDIDIQDLCANANPPCRNPNLKGKMTFYGNVVEDRYTGQKRLNPLASTNSIFDADLLKANAKQSFTLNRFNFELAHGFLIPRAVAYSAGLINYFFRGKIDVEEDPAINAKFVIRNRGPEAMSGTFGIYYDGVDDKRYPLGDITRSAAAGATTIGLALPPIPDNLPEAKTPGEYLLVFRGDMGEEKNSAQAVGAVTAKVFYDPYQMYLRRVAFYVDPPNQNNPTQRYQLAGSFASNFLLGNLVARTRETFRLIVNGTAYPCFVFLNARVFCQNIDTYPYEEFDFSPSGNGFSTGVAQFSWNSSESPSGKITLFLGDAVIFSLTYAAEALQTYASVSFPKSFRVDTSRAFSITSGLVDR